MFTKNPAIFFLIRMSLRKKLLHSYAATFFTLRKNYTSHVLNVKSNERVLNPAKLIVNYSVLFAELFINEKFQKYSR
jgi:hypothetical protein